MGPSMVSLRLISATSLGSLKLTLGSVMTFLLSMLQQVLSHRPLALPARLYRLQTGAHQRRKVSELL
jgi:hypothetical protein